MERCWKFRAQERITFGGILDYLSDDGRISKKFHENSHYFTILKYLRSSEELINEEADVSDEENDEDSNIINSQTPLHSGYSSNQNSLCDSRGIPMPMPIYKGPASNRNKNYTRTSFEIEDPKSKNSSSSNNRPNGSVPSSKLPPNGNAKNLNSIDRNASDVLLGGSKDGSNGSYQNGISRPYWETQRR